MTDINSTPHTMQLEIFIFKSSGKFYASTTTPVLPEVPLFESSFRDIVRDNLPAKVKDGFVLVQDAEGSEGFHIHLYPIIELL